MQNRRLVRGPGAWAPSNTLAEEPGGNLAVPKRGPTNLDLECKESLQRLLKPCNYPAIVPWLGEASIAQKRDMVKLAELARGGGNEISHPVAWLPQTREPVVVNDRGRVRHAKTVHVTADRIQSDLFKSRCGEDVTNVALEKRRRFFSKWASIPSVDSVGDFFHLKDNAIASNPVCQVLTEAAKRALQRWQVDGPEKSAGSSANVMRSLRSLSEACARIPRYRDHVATRSSSQGCREAMYEYSQVAGERSRTLNHAPYAKPDRRIHYSSSSPAMLAPLIAQEEIDQITRPGGYVVGLNDYETVAKLKNRERNKCSKIPLAGGSTEYRRTSDTIGLHALA